MINKFVNYYEEIERYIKRIKEETPFEFEGVKYNKVYFEVQMRTLSCKSNPANMDVVLEGNVDVKRHLLFIESKFLEYCKNGKCKLSDSYFNEENWYNSDVRFLIDSVKSFRTKQNGYCEGLTQNITHLFGLYGLANENARNWFNKNYAGEKIDDFQNVKIRFANFIFEPNEEFEEHEAYVNYENLFEAFVRNFLDNKMKPEWYSYSDIWNKMKDQIRDEKLVEFIETRYMQYVKR